MAEGMALLESQAIAIGSTCPDFDLPSVDGGRFRRDDFREKKALVVMFICRHCPYVIAVEDRIVELRREFAASGVQFVGICSNDANDYPVDAPERLASRAREMHYGFPYLVYVYDQERKLAYHGRIDDSWQDAELVTRRELQEALVAIVDGAQPAADQSPSMGCSIKWKKEI